MPKTRKPRVKKVVEELKEEVSEEKVVDEQVPVTEPEPEPDTVSDLTKSLAKVEVTPKKVKRTRKPSAYNLFVKSAMQRESIKKLPVKERFSACSKLWKAEKAKK